MIKHTPQNDNSSSQISWEGKRGEQLKTGLRDSGGALVGALVDTPMHLADSVASAAKSVASIAMATKNAVNGIFHMTAAPFGMVYDTGARLRKKYNQHIGQHTVRGIHKRDKHGGAGDDLALAA